jgi:hypothetical protein
MMTAKANGDKKKMYNRGGGFQQSHIENKEVLVAECGKIRKFIKDFLCK